MVALENNVHSLSLNCVMHLQNYCNELKLLECVLFALPVLIIRFDIPAVYIYIFYLDMVLQEFYLNQR